MPVYTYRCEKCKEEFEKVLDVKEYDKRVLCECGGSTVKLLKPSTIVIKGRGSYSVSFPGSK